MKKSPLGKESKHGQEYSPDILFPISRFEGRKLLGLPENLSIFHGYDLWNAYEFSWLNNKGKPQCAVLQLRVPANSKNIIESKSLKLFLSSFNFKYFESESALQQCLIKDIASCVGAEITIALTPLNDVQRLAVTTLDGHCLDNIDCEINEFVLNKSFLLHGGEIEVNEKLYTHLFRSLCPVTDQPDWASIFVHYQGKQIDRSGLLKYLLSFRVHRGFHEDCVETIFVDIEKHLKPEKLSVAAFFTRRGGIDINPFRSNFEQDMEPVRLVRQ